MAENDDKNLIGFDPLAWMEGEPEENNQKTEIKADDDVAKKEDNAGDSQIVLESILNIQNVNKLYEELKNGLDRHNKIEIDASAVEQIDTANLQVLAVLKQTAVKLHKEIIFDFPSDKFLESAELLGLSEILELEHAAAGFF